MLGPGAREHVDAYLEYRNLVGDTDGGVLLSEKQFEELKKKAQKAKANELFVSFQNPQGVDCKLIGVQSKCFCGHRYRDHNWFDTETKKVSCRMPGCPCSLFNHIPVTGSQDFKCKACKHSFESHHQKLKKCTKCTCIKFDGSNWLCGCSYNYNQHKTVILTKRERQAAGLPTVSGGGIVPSGGIGAMTDLSDALDRLVLTDSPSLATYGTKKAITGNRSHSSSILPSQSVLEDAIAPIDVTVLMKKRNPFLSQGNITEVPGSIGGRVSLPRRESVEKVGLGRKLLERGSGSINAVKGVSGEREEKKRLGVRPLGATEGTLGRSIGKSSSSLASSKESIEEKKGVRGKSGVTGSLVENSNSNVRSNALKSKVSQYRLR